MKTLLAALALTLPLAAHADPNDQVDIDAMEQQYKNMPGGDMIVKQLEAHRKEIEAGNKKAAAEKKKTMAKAGVDESAPMKSLADLLALIPEQPKSVAEAVKREGQVIDPGKGNKHDGDLKSEPAAKELMRHMMAANHALPNNFKARTINDQEKAALRTADTLSHKIGEATRTSTTKLGMAGAQARTELEQQSAKIQEKWSPQIAKACPDGEGVKESDLVNCKPTIAKRNAELRAAREAYLKKIAPIAQEWRALGKSVIADGEQVHAALKKGFGDETTAPGYANFTIQADGGARQIAAALIGLNDESVNLASVKETNGY